VAGGKDQDADMMSAKSDATRPTVVVSYISEGLYQHLSMIFDSDYCKTTC
jgi:hypothetical protein